MKEVTRIAYKKEGNTWKETFRETDQLLIYRSLSSDLTAKYLNKCQYITRIRKVSNYDGTVNITVWYDVNVKNVYTVKQ